jgi:hypothetical protein
LCYILCKGLDCVVSVLVGRSNKANDLITTQRIIKIGNCKENQTYKEFMTLMSKKEEDEMFQKFQDMINHLDEPTDGNEARKFHGGCKQFLLPL